MTNFKETIQFVEEKNKVTRGSVGLNTQVYGQAITVSAVADATGGLKCGELFSNRNKK